MGQPLGLACVDTRAVGGKVPPECIYVVDSTNGRVLALSPLDLELVWVVVGSPLEGHAGSGDGQLLQPTGIAACGEHFAVCDTGNYRVAIFELDGTFVRNVGQKGVAPGQFAEGPTQVALDGTRLYVVEHEQPRIQVMAMADGAPLRLLVPPHNSPVRGLCIGGGMLFISCVRCASTPDGVCVHARARACVCVRDDFCAGLAHVAIL
eukprot:485294-Prymnesium_polylepis.1